MAAVAVLVEEMLLAVVLVFRAKVMAVVQVIKNLLTVGKYQAVAAVRVL